MKLDEKTTYTFINGDVDEGGDQRPRFEPQSDTFRTPSGAQVTNFRKIEDEDTWIGTIEVFGTPMHFFAIRVKVNAEGIQIGTNDPYHRLDDAYNLDTDICFATTTIPGLSGEFILYAHSFGD
jgi:hypothetical protein